MQEPGRKPAETPSPEEPVRDQLAALRAQQERLFAQLSSGQQHFKQLARSVWRVQEDERRRLARELHDGLGQNLTALKHQIDHLASDTELPTEIRAKLRSACELCASTLEETRALSRMLRPQILDDLGIEAALNWLARSIGESAKMVIEVDVSGLREPLGSDADTLVFRVVQEALNNVAKHSKARHALVRLSTRTGDLNVLIADDGTGCDAEAAAAKASQGVSTGLSSMRERVALFGGQFNFISEPGQGTQVRMSLPMSERRA